ncbi:nuclease-related domain-containing protein [Streptomyces sp. BA2]|uniref:nuclease-related domain-containing protein n=1 Tax=Streptomyces sp. BA2 TaxID=436595 RepID=UPI0013217D32|nr:nuclease-related domain-containing protein [Streptomyces sp. BA2]MWA15441.1 NERD domain-containing protein [Streptomyces sp. BA2]
MSDLKVVRWKRHGQDRLYVNLPDGSAAAWADCRTGKVTILVEPYRHEALRLLRPLLTRPSPASRSSPAVKPKPRTTDGRKVVPELPPLTPPDDLALNRPGESLRCLLAEKGPSPAQRVLSWLLRRESEWDSWRMGLAGERRVGGELQRLSRSGWRVLHSVPLPRDVDIDHLLIGPGGVFSINTKRHFGKSVWVGDEMAKVSHGPPQPYARKSKAEAGRVQAVMERYADIPVQVQPVIVFVGVTELTKAATQFTVRVYREREVSALGPLSGVLDAGQVDALYAVARHRRAWLSA